MPTLTVYGWGTNLLVYRISRHTADVLAFIGIAEDKFEDLFGIGGTEAPIFDETGLTDDDFSITLDDKLVTDFERPPASNLKSKTIADSNSCYLLTEYSYKGSWLSIDIDDDFDRSKLEISYDEYLAPDRSAVTFIEINYNGIADIGDTWSKGVDYTVVYPDGSCYGVEFNED